MKKRQFPVLLVTAIVLLVGGAAAYNAYNTHNANMTPEQAQMEAQRQDMEARQEAMAKAPRTPEKAPDPKELRAAVQAGMKKGRESDPAAGPGRNPMGPGAGGGPSILAPENKPYKPVPNESATSSQWFDKKK